MRYTKSIRLHRIGRLLCLGGASTSCLPELCSGGEFKRNKSYGLSFPMSYPKELRSCHDETSYFIKPQILGESTCVDNAPEEAGGDPVPKACTFCVRSFHFQILTHFSYKPTARNGLEAVLTHIPPRDQ